MLESNRHGRTMSIRSAGVGGQDGRKQEQHSDRTKAMANPLLQADERINEETGANITESTQHRRDMSCRAVGGGRHSGRKQDRQEEGMEAVAMPKIHSESVSYTTTRSRQVMRYRKFSFSEARTVHAMHTSWKFVLFLFFFNLLVAATLMLDIRRFQSPIVVDPAVNIGSGDNADVDVKSPL
mmetsp:Transcript_45834/g.118473  ORF Transcript_45834/g.118473 Transcript_45834/m.118473 type:complete len:182 (-) Transcript_45834:99-644(-)